MKYEIYIVTNSVNAKQYVGITKSLEARWHQHRNMNGSSPYLHAAIKKYGVDAFVFTHIATAYNFEFARQLEQMLISEHNTKAPHGYNLTDGGEGVVGRPMTEEDKEVRRKASIAFVASLSPEERSAKFGTKGRKLTPEQIEKIRAANKGKNLGKKPSPEVRAKMSAAQKNRPRQPMSEETKEKIRQSLLGRKMPDSEKPKHASFLGRKHTEETKAKIKASNIATKALLKAKKLAEQGVENV